MRPLLFPLIALAAASVTPAAAREVDRMEVAERFDTETAQEQRAYCSDTQVFTLANGAEYRACVNWRAQNRTRIIRSYAALDGPETDSDTNLEIARTCFDLAIASQNDPYRQMFDEALFLANAREQFTFCARLGQMNRVDEYGLRIYETGVWLGGR
ncbi:MAG: hypothetical protein ABJP48_00445 [Erythrobacter sp.]